MEMETSYESSCKRSSLALLSESELESNAYRVIESDFVWAFICDFVHGVQKCGLPPCWQICI